MPKHRSRQVRKRIKKAALMGGAAATSAVMTMGLTAPSASALPLIEARSVTAEVQNTALTDVLNLGPLLQALGIPLGDINGPLDALEAAGINIVTTGPPFALAALFGLNLGYVPAFPPLITDEVTSTDTVVNGAALTQILAPLLTQLLGPTGGAVAGLLGTVLNGARVPVVIGFGLGSLGAGMAYPDIADYYANEPGIFNPATILPLILLRNPGRADGGIAARAFPLLDPFLSIFGFNSVVTPEVEGNGIPLLPNSFTPIKIDATVEYDTLSDFAAWPNPFTLANNGAAFLFPTYILRGGDFAALGDQIDLGSVIGEVLTDGAANIFLTVPVDSLPILEPFRYPADIANFFTGGVFGFTNPFADAIEPALKILTNLGYTNVTQDMSNPLDPYPRDFTGNFGDGDLGDGPGGVPFFTLPQNIDWGEVPGDLAEAFFAGVQDAFFYGGIPGVRGPFGGVANPITTLLNLLGLPTTIGDLADRIPGLGDFVEDIEATVGDLLEDLDLQVPGLPGGPDLPGLELPDIELPDIPLPDLPGPLSESSDQARLVSTNTAEVVADDTTQTPTEGTDSVDGEVVDEGDEAVTPKPAHRGTEFEKALRQAGERFQDSVDEAGKRLNDAINGTRDTLNKLVNGPKKPAATDDNDDQPSRDTNTNDTNDDNDNGNDDTGGAKEAA